ncbi:MAG: Dabb family protein [Planctomycetes bacterium]|nr:Dabb family protein [Planctomycetota bacterium]MBL7144639.1 Dabb family protein [Phycisphaerae bacterium]
MLRNVLYLAAGAIILSGCVVNIQREDGLPKDSEVLRHVVLFKFKDTSSSQQIKEIEDAFRALPGKVDEICDFEWGTDVSVENFQQGFTHCFFVTFRNEADRAAYLPHPAHKEFGKILGPHLDKVLVIDYWAAK